MHAFLRFTLTALACLALGAPVFASGDESHKIAAVVNDDIVTALEVEDRIRMVIATTGLSDTAEVRKRLGSQIARAIIDEKLQLQAAKQANITVSEKEIEQAIAAIEKQRGKTGGSLRGYLEERDVPFYTFKHQLEAQLAWNKFISRRIAGTLAVSDEEIARRLEQARSNKREEVQLSSILLPVDGPENEVNVRELAKKLYSEIQAGASFDAVATQLSNAPNPVSRVWAELAQLDPKIANALSQRDQPGVLEPLRTPAGYVVLYLHEKRAGAKTSDAEMLFKEILLKLGGDAGDREVDALMGIARSVAKAPGACAEKGVAGVSDLEGLDFDVHFTRTRLSKISPEVQPLVRDLSVSEVSEPFAAPDGIHLLMLCEKIVFPADRPDLGKIRESILQEKLELEAIRYLRNLRREAFVEIRA